MKKFFAILAVAVTFVACNNAETAKPATDTTKVAADTTKKADTTKVAADTTKKAK